MARAERRRSSRHPIKIPVDYSAVDSFFTEFATNINEGGIFVATENQTEIGEQIQLQFRLPGLAEPVQVQGTVAWISDGKDDSPPGMGIEFGQLSDETRELINNVVRTLRKLP
jgi:type IV pilus assembly protein PilZ